jgi:prepilin-type N-terminal cleavage/methylation domain-containing protein/prepilin-type processing-associated H-X9-DG protein
MRLGWSVFLKITMRRFFFKEAHADGFTLVELLVVMAVVGILAVMLLPAIAGTKPNSQAFQCLENQRTLMLGCQMYAADNTDLLPPNDYGWKTTYASAGAAAQAKMKNWVVGSMIEAQDAGDAPANQAGKVSELLDPNTLLSPYVTIRTVYHCPADNYVDPYAGNRVHVRSYSMNSAVGTIFSSSSAMGGSDPRPLGSPVQGGWLLGRNYQGGQITYLTYGKMTSFNRPGPANTWVFMDENPLTINDSSMATSAVGTPGGTYLIDFPAGNHNGATGISFADGHVVIHKWQDKRTYDATVIPHGSGGQGQFTQSPDNPDCFYLAPITSALR